MGSIGALPLMEQAFPQRAGAGTDGRRFVTIRRRKRGFGCASKSVEPQRRCHHGMQAPRAQERTSVISPRCSPIEEHACLVWREHQRLRRLADVEFGLPGRQGVECRHEVLYGLGLELGTVIGLRFQYPCRPLGDVRSRIKAKAHELVNVAGGVTTGEPRFRQNGNGYPVKCLEVLFEIGCHRAQLTFLLWNARLPFKGPGTSSDKRLSLFKADQLICVQMSPSERRSICRRVPDRSARRAAPRFTLDASNAWKRRPRKNVREAGESASLEADHVARVLVNCGWPIAIVAADAKRGAVEHSQGIVAVAANLDGGLDDVRSDLSPV